MHYLNVRNAEAFPNMPGDGHYRLEIEKSLKYQ